MPWKIQQCIGMDIKVDPRGISAEASTPRPRSEFCNVMLGWMYISRWADPHHSCMKSKPLMASFVKQKKMGSKRLKGL